MHQSSSVSSFPLTARIIQMFFKTNIKGRHRLTWLLARWLKPLQAVPIQIANWSPVYLDLRFFLTHSWLKGAPWQSSPREIDEQAVMRQWVKPGDTVFDIGANLGLHTALLSRLVGDNGRVIAFEPNPELLYALSHTIAAMNNAALYSCALSDESTPCALFVPPHSVDVASLADWTQEEYGSTHTVTCQQQRLDDLIAEQGLPQPDFIKCDVEGAELKVFQGAYQTLNCTDAPIVLFEANIHTARGFGLSTSDAKDLLKSLPLPQYQMFEVQTDGKLSDSETGTSTHSNILAIPASKRGRLLELASEHDTADETAL